MAQPDLQLGELFPPEDVAGQWVFSLSALSNDLQVIMQQLKTVRESEDLKLSFFLYRQLITRLYEARRLIMVIDQQPAIGALIGEKSIDWVDELRKVYVAEGDERSTVEDLYGELRHRTVHYSWPGSDELAEVLRKGRRLPARLRVEKGGPIDLQWVDAVSGMAVSAISRVRTGTTGIASAQSSSRASLSGG